ncbi:MAG TPA: helix-turn-helix domain-containing protein [Sandaracinaceae bacterium LLY-WYZ-13_1]|nr:helix-turn-helix domain-containing protein [Sandaracinaceae bacterium LLY-WYZ-13_1]
MSGTSAAARRARDKRERREGILDAAERVFGEKGATHATMEDVADAAEVSKGTLYLYFKSKDDLFVALTHRPLDAVLDRFAVLTDDDGLDGLTLLRGLIDTHADVMQEHAAHFRVAMGSMCSGFEPDPSVPSFEVYAERVRTLRRTYLAAIERGMTDGTIRADLSAKEVAAALWAAMFGASFLRMNADRFQAPLPVKERLDLGRIVPTLADLLLQALRPREREEDPT